MHEPLDHDDNPTLSERLRAAAVDRARYRGDVVDEVVIDETGVIDLRVPDYHALGNSATEPATALAATRGAFDEFHDVSNLYAPDPEPGRAFWRRGRARTPEAAPSESGPEPALASLPVADEIDGRDEPPAADDEIDLRDDRPAEVDSTIAFDHDPVIVEPEPMVADDPDPDPEVRAGDDERPTDVCPTCGGVGQRDLFDPFSQTDYFSCDDCQHMWQAPHA